MGFFLSLHSCEAIVEDIGCGRVGILVDGNHITRVFVKDDRRGEGLGCIAMGILEKRVLREGRLLTAGDALLRKARVRYCWPRILQSPRRRGPRMGTHGEEAISFSIA